MPAMTSCMLQQAIPHKRPPLATRHTTQHLTQLLVTSLAVYEQTTRTAYPTRHRLCGIVMYKAHVRSSLLPPPPLPHLFPFRSPGPATTQRRRSSGSTRAPGGSSTRASRRRRCSGSSCVQATCLHHRTTRRRSCQGRGAVGSARRGRRATWSGRSCGPRRSRALARVRQRMKRGGGGGGRSV